MDSKLIFCIRFKCAFLRGVRQGHWLIFIRIDENFRATELGQAA